ncbi:hypothetical protein D3C86_981090 [compost metagenome]
MALAVDIAPEQPRHGVHVELAGQVETEDALVTVELLQGEALVLAGRPALHVVERRLGRDPDVEVFGFEGVGKAGRLDRLGLLRLEIFGVDRDPHVGVGLRQYLGVCPIIAFVDGVDDPEQFIVRHRACQHLDYFPPLVIAGAVDVVARGGDGPHQWLEAGPHTGEHCGVEVVAVMLVVFVHDGA